MAKKRKIRYDRLLIVILGGILLCAALIFCVKGLVSLFSKDNTNKDNNTNIPTNVDNKKTSLELVNYEIYEDTNSDLGFNFVVAEIKFSNDEGINYDLASLSTNEGIVLSNIYDYQKNFNGKYNFSLLGTTNSVASGDKEYTCKLFVPYTSTTTVLTLTDSNTNATLSIDLSKEKADINSIKVDDNSTVIVTGDYDISVSNSYISEKMTHNGESYSTAMLSTYTFELKVNAISSGIKITNATFTQTSTGTSENCLDESYASLKIGNILNKELNVGDTYALFFEMPDNPDEEHDYKGTITLNFSDGSSATIDTTLK